MSNWSQNSLKELMVVSDVDFNKPKITSIGGAGAGDGTTRTGGRNTRVSGDSGGVIDVGVAGIV